MPAQRVLNERVGLRHGRAPSERVAGRQTATSGKPAWAVEADRLWTDLLQELALAAGDAIAVESLDELESLEQAS